MIRIDWRFVVLLSVSSGTVGGLGLVMRGATGLIHYVGGALCIIAALLSFGALSSPGVVAKCLAAAIILLIGGLVIVAAIAVASFFH